MAKKLSSIAYHNGLIPIDITKVNGMEIKIFKVGKLHKKDGLSHKELTRVIKYINDLDDDMKGIRIKLLFSLLFTQGLRQIEVSRLKTSDIDLVSKKAFIYSKGSDDKELIILHDSVVVLIKRYMKLSKRRDGYLFYALTSYNAGSKLDPSGIKKIITKVFKDLNIDKTTHCLRHSYVNQLFKYYTDLTTIASYTRHANLNMLLVYKDELNKEQDRPKYNRAFKEVEVV